MSMTNVELARRGYEAALRGDLATVRVLLDPDVQWHGGDPTDPAACHDRDQALAFMRRAQGRQPVAELVELIDAGDQVVLILRPRSADGQPGELAANVTTFRGGKAVEMVHFPSPADALAAAGVQR
jgi:ketosteroid isomerase-like protein